MNLCKCLGRCACLEPGQHISKECCKSKANQYWILWIEHHLFGSVPAANTTLLVVFLSFSSALLSQWLYVCSFWQKWTDYQLQWDEEDYPGVSNLRFSGNQIWKPDILLYNRWVGWVPVENGSSCFKGASSKGGRRKRRAQKYIHESV